MHIQNIQFTNTSVPKIIYLNIRNNNSSNNDYYLQMILSPVWLRQQRATAATSNSRDG
ncbi:hypothetical protein HanRHA438_Chr04g0195731 [Helianthus annuus]|nr:hypothetical protein HanRHA438_Chr04g0195731 [Helianthus annuus]